MADGTERAQAGERGRQRRVAAIARAAANLASQDSLPAILDAIAAEVLQADALAAVQILTLDAAGRHLRVMGSAGFGHWPDFFDRLMECRRRGATLRMIEAVGSAEPVLVANRWAMIRDDPAWEPLREYLSERRWESFASIPLIARGKPVGVLNAFFAPGQAMEPRTVEFLVAMADQAAIAVDYADLLRRARDGARREERQRLARDLHDSIVQQVFSISMQAKSLEVLAGRGDAVPGEAVRRIAGEVGGLSQAALADLRAMVHELRPSALAELGGLAEALRVLAKSTANRTGLTVGVSAGRGLDAATGELAEDVYRIIAEALHNAVRHAGATTVAVRLAVRDGRLAATVTDDGRGIEPGARETTAGYGLTAMRERAERWGGTVAVTPGRGGGTAVRVAVPLADGTLAGGTLAGWTLTDRTLAGAVPAACGIPLAEAGSGAAGGAPREPSR